MNMGNRKIACDNILCISILHIVPSVVASGFLASVAFFLGFSVGLLVAAAGKIFQSRFTYQGVAQGGPNTHCMCWNDS